MPVWILVAKVPTLVTVPSVSPTLTYSPGRSERDIGHAHARHGLADDARRADRQHQAGQHRQALEALAAGARQVGVGHGQREEPDVLRRPPCAVGAAMPNSGARSTATGRLKTTTRASAWGTPADGATGAVAAAVVPAAAAPAPDPAGAS
jgi:hypothetical protein